RKTRGRISRDFGWLRMVGAQVPSDVAALPGAGLADGVMPPQPVHKMGPLPPTSLQLLKSQIADVQASFERLLDFTQVVYEDVNADSSDFVIIGWMPHR